MQPSSMARWLACNVCAVLFVPGHLGAQTAPRPVVEYRVKIDSPAREAAVTAVFTARPALVLMDSVIGGSWASRERDLPKGWATFLRQIRAATHGQAVDLVRSGPTTWSVPPGDGPLEVSYTVDLAFTRESWPVGNEQAGYDAGDAIYLVGRPLFVTSDVPGPGLVTFELPPGWRASTPWEPVGDAFLAPSHSELVRNSFVVGRHAALEVTSGSMTLVLALPGPIKGAASIVEPVLRRTMDAYLRLFDRTPRTRYLMTFFYAAADDGESFSRSAAFTTSDSVSRESLIVWGNFLAHELFHFWNGQQIRGSGDRRDWRWFAEGFTEYFANVVLAREGLISDELLLKKVERHLGNYLYFMTSPAFQRMSLVEAGRNTGAFRFGVYDGGWTAALCLDGLIRQGSGGRRSLDDFMREAYGRWGMGSAGYRLEDLGALASEVAGRELGGFLTRYTTTIDILPVRECLARVGLRGAFKTYAAEAFVSRDSRTMGRWP